MNPPCIRLDPNEFFPPPSVTPRKALACCRRCDHITACARAALDTPMVCGIWAGVRIPDANPGRRTAFARLREIAGDWAPPPPRRRALPRGNQGRCVECDRVTVGARSAYRDGLPVDARRYGGRGLCEACFQYHRRSRITAVPS